MLDTDHLDEFTYYLTEIMFIADRYLMETGEYIEPEIWHGFTMLLIDLASRER